MAPVVAPPGHYSRWIDAMKYPEEILRERIKVLEEALEFYANKRNWEILKFYDNIEDFEADANLRTKVEEDYGRLAREALKKERQ